MEAGTCKKELAIEISVDVIQREADSVAVRYARLARLPGFRPGRAPATLVRRQFRDDIRAEVAQSLLTKFFENAVKERKWSVVGRPRFDELKFEDDQPLTCKATFEVYPEFELKEFKGLEVEEELPTVTDTDIEQAIEELRQHVATFEVVEGHPATEDDYAIVNYQGRDLSSSESHPIEARDALVHLGGKGTVGAFTENLRGSKPGEVREFQVTYPEDYPQRSLSRKTFSYHVEVQSIKKKVVPPIDDDLARSVGECATLTELRDKLRQDLKDHRKRRVEITTRQKLLEQVLEKHLFPVPEVLVEEQLNRKLERALAQLMAQGIDPRATEIDWRKLREESRPEAEKEVRASVILEKIAEKENIDTTEEEVDELVRELAKERHETAPALKARLTREGDIDRIKFTRRNQKALDFVYRNAQIIRKSEPDPAQVEG